MSRLFTRGRVHQGTWTPTITATGGTIVLDSASGVWRRQGAVIRLTWSVGFDKDDGSWVAGTGALTLASLPFAMSSGDYIFHTGIGKIGGTTQMLYMYGGSRALYKAGASPGLYTAVTGALITDATDYWNGAAYYMSTDFDNGESI